MRPMLGKIKCPTLVVQGMEDEHAPSKHAEDIATAIPGAELWLEPGVGHMLQRDAAGKFNNRILEFLRRRMRDG
jgi:pimeloyl-ACP methyl ester carboxylesterase